MPPFCGGTVATAQKPLRLLRMGGTFLACALGFDIDFRCLCRRSRALRASAPHRADRVRIGWFDLRELCRNGETFAPAARTTKNQWLIVVRRAGG